MKVELLWLKRTKKEGPMCLLSFLPSSCLPFFFPVFKYLVHILELGDLNVKTNKISAHKELMVTFPNPRVPQDTFFKIPAIEEQRT